MGGGSMREILFRGKRIDNGEWVEGYLGKSVMHLETFHQNVVVDTIEVYDGKSYLNIVFRNVSANSICQFTGLTDKNGTKVFEGDILKFTDTNAEYEWIGKVAFGNPNAEYNWGFQLVYISGTKPNTDILLWFDMEETGAFSEVIGNIHDNPELLEVSE